MDRDSEAPAQTVQESKVKWWARGWIKLTLATILLNAAWEWMLKPAGESLANRTTGFVTWVFDAPVRRAAVVTLVSAAGAAAKTTILVTLVGASVWRGTFGGADTGTWIRFIAACILRMPFYFRLS